MVVIIMKYIVAELKDNFRISSEDRAQHLGEVFRMDAKAEGERALIGGWRVRGEGSTVDGERADGRHVDPVDVGAG